MNRRTFIGSTIGAALAVSGCDVKPAPSITAAMVTHRHVDGTVTKYDHPEWVNRWAGSVEVVQDGHRHHLYGDICVEYK